MPPDKVKDAAQSVSDHDVKGDADVPSSKVPSKARGKRNRRRGRGDLEGILGMPEDILQEVCFLSPVSSSTSVN